MANLNYPEKLYSPDLREGHNRTSRGEERIIDPGLFRSTALSTTFMEYKYIVIEGNIGAGKTSLARIIADKHNADIILEQYADNPFLPKFYEDPGRYSFSLEMSFLATRYHQLSGDLQKKKTQLAVADYAISKSLVFSRTTLQPDEFKLYQQLFDIISSQLPTPDLYVYLYLPADLLLNNIGPSALW